MQGAFSALQFRPPAGFPTPARAAPRRWWTCPPPRRASTATPSATSWHSTFSPAARWRSWSRPRTTWRRVARISRSRAGGRPAATAAARAAGASGPAWTPRRTTAELGQTAHSRQACHRATRLHRAPRSKPHAAQVPHVSRQDYSLLDISDDGFVRPLRSCAPDHAPVPDALRAAGVAHG